MKKLILALALGLSIVAGAFAANRSCTEGACCCPICCDGSSGGCCG